MTIESTPRFVDIEGRNPARVDANTVVCIRVDTGEQGSIVVVHTNEGFGFGLSPDTDQSVKDFYKEVLATVWPEKTRRTTK